jgi:hypothetical protein
MKKQPSRRPERLNRGRESTPMKVNQRKSPAPPESWMRRRQLVAEAIRADPACSDRSIAHDLSVSRNLVARMRRELAAAGETVLGLPVRGRDGLTYKYKNRHVSRAAELDRLYSRLYSVVKVVESEEFARTYRAGSETERGVLRRTVARLLTRLERLEREEE